ncbi:hypothetical protein EAI_05040, partial [Harpegnathos saltator]
LNPLDFFMVFLKSIMYSSLINDVDELHRKI